MMVDMGLFHAFGVANMLEMNPSDVRLLVFPPRVHSTGNA